MKTWKKTMVFAGCLTALFANASNSMATFIKGAIVDQVTVTEYRSGTAAYYALYLSVDASSVGTPTWTGSRYFYFIDSTHVDAYLATALTALATGRRIDINVQDSANSQGSLVDVLSVSK